jgi:hypothetical protein
MRVLKVWIAHKGSIVACDLYTPETTMETIINHSLAHLTGTKEIMEKLRLIDKDELVVGVGCQANSWGISADYSWIYGDEV